MNIKNSQISATSPAISLSVSPRFEIFHALRLILGPAEGADETWYRNARARLPMSFFDRVTRLCDNPILWANASDAVESRALDGSFFDLLKAHAEMDPERFRYVMIEGMLHSTEIAEDLISGRMSLKQALDAAPDEKREWYGFLGLYPFNPDASIAKFFDRFVKDPENVKDEIVRILSEFWDYVFEDTWETMLPSLTQSERTMERTISSCDLSEIASRALLRVEIDEEARLIRAARGGYELPFDAIDRIHMLPSAFNVNRLWTVFEDNENGRATVVFPYFDPAIEFTDQLGKTRAAIMESIEPALVFRALGDSTRYAIVTILAKEPVTAVELAKRLGLTKATVSHHVHKLRVAGLINEDWDAGSARLSLKRQVFERLSTRTIEDLYKI